MPKLTAARLRSVLHYDPKTGKFTWIARTARCIKIGDEAGSLNGEGYVQIQVDKVSWAGHRLAWFYMRGRIPRQVDHENLIRSDNKFSNLRPATGSQNTTNQAKRENTSSRFKGVTWNKRRGKWQAGIKVRGRSIHLGLFDDERPAHDAYVAAARKYFGNFARAA